MARGKTPQKKSKEVPFGLDKIEKYNAEKEAVESEEEDDAISGDDEEVLDLGLSDDEYDFGEDDEGEEEEDEEGDGGYVFDEDAYDRKEKLRKLDEDDAELLDLKQNEDAKSFSTRLERHELHKGNKGDLLDVEEARRLAKERAASLQEDDFDMDSNTVLKSKKKSKDDKLREQFDADLDAIDFGETQVETVTKKIDNASVQDKLAKIKRESPELLSFLQELREKSHELNDTIIPILQKVKSKKIPTSQGISFLEAKHQLLLNYCTNLSFYLLLKSQGHPVKDHPVVDQLARVRAMLEKARPLEKKLSYQIDKLVRSANLGALAGGNEELTEKANPNALEMDSDEEESAELGLYKAPRISEEIMERDAVKESEKILKSKRRIKGGLIAKFLDEEYGDRPVESNPNLATGDYELTTQEKELEELEELNMRRKELTKEDRKRYQKRLERQNDPLAGIGDYNDLSVYEDDMGEKKKDEEFLAAKRMRAHMDAIDARARSKKRVQSDDVDTYVAPKKARTGQGMLSSDLFDDENIHSDEEVVEERRPRFDEGGVPEPEAMLAPGDKRKASKRIEENRGLVRIRNKDIKTPHLKYRRKFARKVGQMGGAGKIRSQDQKYTGEKRINPNVSRSKSFTNY